MSTAGAAHLGTYIAPVGSDPDEYFCFTEDWNYDWTFGTIRDDKRLRKVFKTMRDFGDHLQYSIFECQFSPIDLAKCRYTLGEIIAARQATDICSEKPFRTAAISSDRSSSRGSKTGRS